MRNERRKRSEEKAKRKFLIPVIIVIALVLGGAAWWYIDYIKYISTDDALVDGNIVSVGSKILGRISSINVDEGDTVLPGQLVVQLDTTDLVAQKKQMLAMRYQTISQKAQAEAKFKFDNESIALLKINLEKAEDDYNRAKKQHAGNVISDEQFEHMQKAYESAKAQYDASHAQLDLSRSQINSAEAAIKSADAQMGVILSQLDNTKLVAPAKAVVAKKWLLNGDVVSPGQSILSLIQDDKAWVSVYMEETYLHELRDGQKAKFTIDAYPGVTFKGHVYYVGSSTESQFSLIPPNNASGNFTKITQRIPLKISVDNTDDGTPLSHYRIMPGMSAVVKIYKK